MHPLSRRVEKLCTRCPVSSTYYVFILPSRCHLFVSRQQEKYVPSRPVPPRASVTVISLNIFEFTPTSRNNSGSGCFICEGAAGVGNMVVTKLFPDQPRAIKMIPISTTRYPSVRRFCRKTHARSVSSFMNSSIYEPDFIHSNPHFCLKNCSRTNLYLVFENNLLVLAGGRTK